jgi:hypothetical protein
MPKNSPTSLDEARLLPRFRDTSPLLERRRMLRIQAKVLADAIAANPDKPLPLRRELTKPGDPRRLRGIPAIGPSVGGAIPGTNPEAAAIAAVTREERLAA